MSDGAQNPVTSTETVFAVLETLHEQDGGTPTDVARALDRDLTRAAVESHLQALEAAEYVVESDGVYRVGLRFLEFGGYARNRNEVYEVAKPEVDRLARETGNLVNLMVEEHGWGVHLYRGSGDSAVHPINYLGTRAYLHVTAMGKAILAHLPPARVDEIVEQRGLPAVTPQTVSDREALATQLEAIRERGHAIDDEELVEGLRCVGVPVFDSSGAVVAGISAAGPTHRFKGAYVEQEIPEQLKEAANVMELNLSYS